MASGGHSAGAGQSPVTSHGVATQCRPVAIVAATSQIPTMKVAPNGTAILPSVRQRRPLIASTAMDVVIGSAIAITTANAATDPNATARKLAESSAWLRMAV